MVWLRVILALLTISFYPPFLRMIWGNDEDGWDGDPGWQADNAGRWWFRVTLLRRIAWGWRNFAHNLMFHVLGFYGEQGLSWHGRFQGVFASDDPAGVGHSWNWGYVERIGMRRYPFISYEGWLGRGALGWTGGGKPGSFYIRPPMKLVLGLLVGLAAAWLGGWL